MHYGSSLTVDHDKVLVVLIYSVYPVAACDRWRAEAGVQAVPIKCYPISEGFWQS